LVFTIGLTGGISSGKSTVAHSLVELGASLIDADQVARVAIKFNSLPLTEIFEIFSLAILDIFGNLNRRYLREIIFGGLEDRACLNAIIHPRVAILIEIELKNLEVVYPESVIVVDIPLLFESGWSKYYYTNILVYAPQKIQKSRLIFRDFVNEKQACVILEAQMSLDDKYRLAYFVIDNSGGLTETFVQTWVVWNKILKIAALKYYLKI